MCISMCITAALWSFRYSWSPRLHSDQILLMFQKSHRNFYYYSQKSTGHSHHIIHDTNLTFLATAASLSTYLAILWATKSANICLNAKHKCGYYASNNSVVGGEYVGCVDDDSLNDLHWQQFSLSKCPTLLANLKICLIFQICSKLIIFLNVCKGVWKGRFVWFFQICPKLIIFLNVWNVYKGVWKGWRE